MVAIGLLVVVLVGILALLLARFRAPRSQSSDADVRPLMTPATLRETTIELLEAMGLTVEKTVGDESSFTAVRKEPFGEVRYVVVLAPSADQAAILAAAESVKGEGASRGMLITLGPIDAQGLAGLDVPLELIDPPRLRELLLQHLPKRVAMVDRYRGFGAPALPPIAQPA